MATTIMSEKDLTVGASHTDDSDGDNEVND